MIAWVMRPPLHDFDFGVSELYLDGKDNIG